MLTISQGFVKSESIIPENATATDLDDNNTLKEKDNQSQYNNSQKYNQSNQSQYNNSQKSNTTKINNVGNSTTNKGGSNKTIETYKRQESKGIITYTFNTGEILELKVSNNSINKDNAIYKTSAVGNYVIFAGDRYERLVPNNVMYLVPIIVNITNKTLKINETLRLKDNYSFIVYEINNREFKSRLLKNNRTIRDIIINRNSPILSIAYWKEINEFKKQKMVQIDAVKINQKDVVIGVTQYGDKKVIVSGSKFGEFQVTNITDNSIIMKNFQSIKADIGKEILLMNGKIKIKI